MLNRYSGAVIFHIFVVNSKHIMRIFVNLCNTFSESLSSFAACVFGKEWMVLIYLRDCLICQMYAPEEVIRVIK